MPADPPCEIGTDSDLNSWNDLAGATSPLGVRTGSGTPQSLQSGLQSGLLGSLTGPTQTSPSLLMIYKKRRCTASNEDRGLCCPRVALRLPTGDCTISSCLESGLSPTDYCGLEMNSSGS